MKVVGADNSPPRYVFCVSLLSDVVYAVLFGPGAVLHATPYAVPSGLSRGPFASPERPLACPRPHDFLLSAECTSFPAWRAFSLSGRPRSLPRESAER